MGLKLCGRERSWPNRGTAPEFTLRAEKNHENLETSHCPCGCSNPVPPESKALSLHNLLGERKKCIQKRIHGKPTQFREVPYLVVRLSRFATKLGMGARVRFYSSP